MKTKNRKSFKELFDAAKRSTTTYPAPISVPVKIVNDHSPVVELVNRIVEEALVQNASDIHVEPGTIAGRLRYRIDGKL